MADPFQNVDAAGAEFIKVFADAMDVRQSDPTMERIVATYLDALNLSEDGLIIEVGAGAGAVSRRIAAHASGAQVRAFEPSAGFVQEARARAVGLANLSFESADGAALPVADACADCVVMHTVLTHVSDPMPLLREAYRVLKPAGKLVVCDADFSKSTFSNFPNDPLDCCAREFVSHFVTEPYIAGKLRQLVKDIGLSLLHFDLDSRVSTTREAMFPWVQMTSKQMVERGDIGQGLADALIAEYERRAENGTLFGYQAFVTAIAQKS